jgi:hypothetical protein
VYKEKTTLKFVDEGKNKRIFHILMEFVSCSTFIYFELLNYEMGSIRNEGNLQSVYGINERVNEQKVLHSKSAFIHKSPVRLKYLCSCTSQCLIMMDELECLHQDHLKSYANGSRRFW